MFHSGRFNYRPKEKTNFHLSKHSRCWCFNQVSDLNTKYSFFSATFPPCIYQGCLPVTHPIVSFTVFLKFPACIIGHFLLVITALLSAVNLKSEYSEQKVVVCTLSVSSHKIHPLSLWPWEYIRFPKNLTSMQAGPSVKEPFLHTRCIAK